MDQQEQQPPSGPRRPNSGYNPQANPYSLNAPEFVPGMMGNPFAASNPYAATGFNNAPYHYQGAPSQGYPAAGGYHPSQQQGAGGYYRPQQQGAYHQYNPNAPPQQMSYNDNPYTRSGNVAPPAASAPQPQSQMPNKAPVASKMPSLPPVRKAEPMPSLPPVRKVLADPVPSKPAATSANPTINKLTSDLKSSSLEDVKKAETLAAKPVTAAVKPAVVASEEKGSATKKPAAEVPKKDLKSKIANVVIAHDDAGRPEKEHINILFMGHVDAGKSTMGGHLLLLTGMVDKRTMEKYEKEAKELGRESWYLSWALDLNSEERNKGKTTEYGRGYFETEKRKYTILDAPGHKQFVPSMIGASAQADVGVLVISARKGEFETGFERGGQTREHAMLAKTSGVKRLILVINKMDDPSVEWAKERYDEISTKIMPFLKGVGYGKNDIDVMPISGYTGANMKDRLTSDVCDWYSGPSLIELLDNLQLTDRRYDGAFMMPIADKMKDMGTLVTGKIESGRVKKGQAVMIMPNKQITEVLAILQEDAEIPVAISGDNVRIRLKNVEEEDVSPGFVLCTAENPVQSVMAFEAQLSIVEYKSIICSGYTAVLHAHAAVEEVSLTLLHKVDKKTGRKSKTPPQFVRQGDACIVRVDLAQLLCLETYADYPQLGRFTLRDEGKTVAIGKVVRLLDTSAEEQ